MTRARSHTPVPWSVDADATLRQMWAEGYGIEDAMVRLGRSYDAVKKRIVALGIQRNRNPSPPWSEERTELLKQLMGQGLSASQIAVRLGGITRNAVIGKVHRMQERGQTSRRLGARPGPKPRTPAVRPVAKPEPMPPPQVLRQAPTRKAITPWRRPGKGVTTPAPPKPRPAPAAPGGQGTISITDATSRHCRYIGDRPAIVTADTPIFCGALATRRADGEPSSYCEAHHQLCTTKPYGRLERAVRVP